MATKEKMVSGVFRNRADWQNTFEWLRDRGYSPQEINVLMSETTRQHYLATEKKEGKISAGTHAAEGVGVGGAIGTAVGATVGAILMAGSTLMIPALGLGLLVAGPIAGALAGGGAGAVTGGIVGGLVGLGIPESNARAYEEALKEGGVVVGVHPRSSDEASTIKDYFEKHNGENVCYC
jgi:hypothetical protein